MKSKNSVLKTLYKDRVQYSSYFIKTHFSLIQQKCQLLLFLAHNVHTGIRTQSEADRIPMGHLISLNSERCLMSNKIKFDGELILPHFIGKYYDANQFCEGV